MKPYIIIMAVLAAVFVGCGENALERYGGVIENNDGHSQVVVNAQWDSLTTDQKIDLVRALGKKNDAEVIISQATRTTFSKHYLAPRARLSGNTVVFY